MLKYNVIIIIMEVMVITVVFWKTVLSYLNLTLILLIDHGQKEHFSKISKVIFFHIHSTGQQHQK